MQSLLQPFVAAVLGIAGLALSLLLLPIVLALVLAIGLIAAGGMAYARWRLRRELAGMEREAGPAPAGAARQTGQRARGRVIEADYEVVRER
ncbi:MAG: hypothetical protein R3D28_03995 [Geminicoccaceae bacterium]